MGTCCQNKATCNTMTCPVGKIKKGKPTEILCAGATCDTTAGSADETTCCEDLGACATYSCPSSSASKSDADNLYCFGPICDPNEGSADELRCCDLKQRCNCGKPSGATVCDAATQLPVSNYDEKVCDGATCAE